MLAIPILCTGARLPLFCLILTLFSAFASRDIAAQSTFFDDVPAMYESVFSELDDSYLSTGILAERAYPVFPFHTRFGDLPYHDSLVTTPSSFPWAVGMIQHMTNDSVAHLSSWLRDSFYDRLTPSATSDTLHLSAIALQFDRFATAQNIVDLLWPIPVPNVFMMCCLDLQVRIT